MAPIRIRLLSKLHFFYFKMFFFLAEELMASFEIAKKKCFFPTEELIVSIQMFK
jgi:hypothetical protein